MNILWLVLGGVVTAVEYIVASVGMMVTIIGIPFGIQTLKIGLLALCPFGKRIESTPQSGGCLSIIMNLLWIILGGIWISLTHLAFGLLLCITIIGIPFGKQAFKMAKLSLFPFGKKVNLNFGKHPIANIFWIIFGGLELMFFYAFEGIFYCITIIGIPFGKQCFKQASLTLAPFGATIE